jgi:hypothetical protein
MSSAVRAEAETFVTAVRSAEANVSAAAAAAAIAGLIAAVASWAWISRFGHITVPVRLGAVFLPMALAGLLTGERLSR